MEDPLQHVEENAHGFSRGRCHEALARFFSGIALHIRAMTEHDIPKGVSLETLHEILAGWSEAGAGEEPRYTADVEEVTSVSDVVGRQSRFLEELGVLESHEQRHELTDAGRRLASALAEGDEERARTEAWDLLADWGLTGEVRGVLAANPMERETLVPLVAELAGQDRTASRVESGLTTLLDLYEWAGLLERDGEGRYRLPASGDGTEAGERATDAAEGTPADPDEVDAVSELVAEVVEAATEAQAAAREARAAAEAARTAAEDGAAGDDGPPATEPHAVSLDLDVDSDDLEAIVEGVRRGLTAEE